MNGIQWQLFTSLLPLCSPGENSHFIGTSIKASKGSGPHNGTLFCHMSGMYAAHKSLPHINYQELMVSYIHDLENLHLHTTKRSNPHMSLHIYEFPKLFGPIYSWWCFPFEQLIGILLRLPTNHRPGIESILLHISVTLTLC
jgi:hypothetical protein